MKYTTLLRITGSIQLFGALVSAWDDQAYLALFFGALWQMFLGEAREIDLRENFELVERYIKKYDL